MTAIEEDSKTSKELEDCKEFCSRLLPNLHLKSEPKTNDFEVKTEIVEEINSSPVIELKIENDNPNVILFKMEDSEFEPVHQASSSGVQSEISSREQDSEMHCCPEIEIKQEIETILNSKQKRPKINLIKDGETGKYICTYCSFQTRHSTTMKDHLLIHTGEMPFACTICPYKARQQSHLKRHILTHGSETPFSCKFCSFRTSQKAYLKTHIQTHTMEKPFVCNLCSFRTRRRASLNNHALNHTTETPIACPLCVFRTKRNASLKKHILAQHSGDYRYSM